MIKVAITGSSGFIGKHLIKFLKKEKEIIVIPFSRKKKKIFYFIKDYSKIKKKYDFLIYLSEDANSLLYNVLKKEEILKYKSTIKKLSNLYKNRLIYFSSASMYSDKLRSNIRENYKIYPNSLYSKNKIECEKIVKKNNGIILRLTNIIGKNMPNRNIITTVLKQIKKKEIIIQNKFPVRDFLHIDDLQNLILKIIKKPKSGIYNVGSGKGIKVYNLAKAIVKKIDKKKRIISMEKKFKFSRKVLDIKRTSKDFGWSPKIKILSEIKNLL